MVVGYVAVVQAGTPEELVKCWPVVPAAVIPIADVPLPYRIPLVVIVAKPVPPPGTVKRLHELFPDPSVISG